MSHEIAEFAHDLHAGLSSLQVSEFDDLQKIGMAASLAIHIKGLGEIEYEVLRKDWKKMLVVGETMVTIYDFDKVLASGSLAGNETSTLQVKLVSAFFVGTGATRIVGADYSNSVKMWSENAQAKTWSMTEIYRGDNGVFYAEPDATGQRLIVMESTGGGSVRGFLYSVQAREIWSGTEYKWLGAAFAGPSGSEIPVSEHNTWMRVVPILPLSRLVALAEQSLAPECVPANPKDYRSSRCWPPGQ